MNDFAWQFSESLAGAVDKAAAGVVRINGRRRRPSSGVIWSSGVVVTTHHVLEWEEDIAVGFPDGSHHHRLRGGPRSLPPTWRRARRRSHPGAARVGGRRRGESRPSGDVPQPPGRKIRASLGLVRPARPGAPPRRPDRHRDPDRPRHPHRLFRQRPGRHAGAGDRRQHRRDLSRHRQRHPHRDSAAGGRRPPRPRPGAARLPGDRHPAGPAPPRARRAAGSAERPADRLGRAGKPRGAGAGSCWATRSSPSRARRSGTPESCSPCSKRSGSARRPP